LDNANADSYLQLNISNDLSEKIATWVDEIGIKASFIEDSSDASGVTNFELQNLSLEGEEYALLTVEDFVSDLNPAQLDIIYLIDTSNSMKLERTAFCNKKDFLEAEISAQGIDVLSTAYAIDSLVDDAICVTEIAQWGDEFFIQENVSHNPKEAWGPALQDVLSNHSWRDNAKRVAVILSDTGALGEIEVSVGEPSNETGEIPDIGVVLGNTVQMAKDQNVAVSALIGVPFETENLWSLRGIVDRTGGFLKTFEVNGNEKFFANQLLKTVFETKSQTFHIRLEGEDVGVCIGANDRLGITGSDALPRVQLDWSWNSIGLDTCNLGNSDYVYCDATQLTKQIVKRLIQVREKTINGDFEVGSLLTFKAFLIKDSYSSSFTQAFDKYVNENEFLPLDEYKTDWTKFVRDQEKFSFKSNEHSIVPIPSTGQYLVNIVYTSPFGRAWQFFENDESVGTIEVFLTLEEEIVLQNPFYFLPFDSQVGLTENSEALHRTGFGVQYIGDNIKIIQEGETQQVSTFQTLGTGVTVLDIGFENEFEQLNKGSKRGVLLSVKKVSNGYSMIISPSIATPVLLEIISENQAAEGFFELREENDVVSVENFYSIWSGVASSFGPCSDFGGQNLPVKQPDSSAIGATCRFDDDATASTSQGFSWSNAAAGRVFLKTIFYTPNTNYKIRNSCVTDALITSPDASTSQGFLNLDFGAENVIVSLKNLFDLVEDGKACVGETGSRIDFWWNESNLYEELENKYSDYFNRISEVEENFSICSVG